MAATHTVRPGEWRLMLAGMATMFVVMAAHALLETARDALFLAHVAPTQLPWAYLILALVAVALAQASSGVVRTLGGRGSIMATQVFAGGGTAVFAFLVIDHASEPWVYYALYIWTGVASALVVVRFWLVLGDLTTVSQAKRLYPLIAAGGVAGVLAGFALAGVIASHGAGTDLIRAGAVAFLLSAAGPLFLPKPIAGDRAHAPDRAGRLATTPSLREILRRVARHPYVHQVALILFVASLTATLGDFLFKSVVAREVAVAQLDSFFATTYFLLNVLSLLVLLVAVTPVLRRIGVTAALAVLPLMLAVAGLGVAVIGSFAAVMVLKGADGALRFSLHKTAAELLYVPMSSTLRRVVKGAVDSLAQRGGQAIGSLLILLCLAVGGGERAIAVLLVACAVVWVLSALRARDTYVDLFRQTLREGVIQTRTDFPELDVDSLETLILALNSSDDRKVLAAMDLLQEQDRVGLIPALILYHPSPPVVVHALDLLLAAGRTDFLPLAIRLVRHEYAEVRAAALRTSAALQADPAVLESGLDHNCPVVNVTALVGLIAAGRRDAAVAIPELQSHIRNDSHLVRPMIARAIRQQPLPMFAPLLLELAQVDESETRHETILAMRTCASPDHLSTLVGFLARGEFREEVRQTLLHLGTPALHHLASALSDSQLPYRQRIHLPRTISRFQGRDAAAILVRHLAHEPRGMIRFKILRGLGRMVANDPDLPLDNAVLDQAVSANLTTGFQRLHRCHVIEEEAPDEARQTNGHALLCQFLHDQGKLAIERLLRTIGLRYRSEDVATIYSGLISSDAVDRSSSRELLETFLPFKLARAVVGLTEDLPAAARLDSGLDYYQPVEASYREFLGGLAQAPSPTLSSIARYHAGELGWQDFSAAPAVDGAIASLVVAAGSASSMAERAPVGSDA